MNKIIFSGVFILLLLAGCASHTMMLGGERIEILSPAEEAELVSTARATVAKSRQLSRKEQQLIREQTPRFKIRYTSSRTGDASVTWKIPGKTVTLLIRGTFFEGSAQWVMKVGRDQPAVLDFR